MVKNTIARLCWVTLAAMSRICRSPKLARRQRTILRKGILEYDQQDFFRFHNVSSAHAAFRREAASLASSRPSVLDFGGGDGSHFRYIFKGIEGFPADYSVLDINKKPDTENVIVADACKPITFDQRFDVSFSHSALEHMAEPFVVAQNMFDVLKPGGLVMANTVFACHHHASPDDYWRFTDSGLRYIFEKAGFETIEFGYDVTERRKEKLGGHIPESMPLIDSQGGWRERWWVFYIGRRPAASG